MYNIGCQRCDSLFLNIECLDNVVWELDVCHKLLTFHCSTKSLNLLAFYRIPVVRVLEGLSEGAAVRGWVKP